MKFGTDGIRGLADVDLTSDLVLALGRAAARVLGIERTYVVGRDTRESGPRIAAELMRGLTEAGASVLDAGVIPTPGVAFLSADAGGPGAMVSASHNPWPDNGIKLFAAGGLKLDDAAEAAVEAALEEELERSGAHDAADPTMGADLIEDGGDAVDRYCAHLVEVLDGRRLDGLKVVVDCANGAASRIAPRVLRSLGAQVAVIHAEPDGRNVNRDCGSTHPGDLQRAVTAAAADLGLAFDGDADRVIAVDESGEIVDGDQIIVIAALDLHARGLLRNDAVAVTVMSNLGLRRALTDAGVGVLTTPVGDRSILEALREHDFVLGGEQSGHVVFTQHATTGDGTLSGLVLLDCMARNRAPLSALAAAMKRFPQVLENVRLDVAPDLDHADDLWMVVRREEAALGDRGRVLVRSSGTEPVVRVMVESASHEEAVDVARRIAAAVRSHFSTDP